MKYIFIYNNSKKGQKNHERFLDTGAEFVSKALTIGGYSLHAKYQDDIVLATMVKDDKSRQVIRGELYKVPVIDQLDLWEGHPYFFKREKIKVIIESKNTIEEVEAYIFIGDLGNSEYIKGGVYEEYCHELPISLVA